MNRPLSIKLLSRWFGFSALFLLSPFDALKAEVAPVPEFRNLSELIQRLHDRGRIHAQIKLEGIVCAVDTDRNLLVLQDGTATGLLELASIPRDLGKGQRVAISSPACGISRGARAIQLGTAPVVDVDGNHPTTTKEGSIRLVEGMHPFRLEWFNGVNDAALNLQFGPAGGSARDISDSVFRSSGSGGGYLPGLEYACYEGVGWRRLPEFEKLEPVKRGILSAVGLEARSRKQDVAMVFTGFLKCAASGDYSFTLLSDDGAKLFVDASDVFVHVTESTESEAVNTLTLSSGDEASAENRWVSAGGTVTFVAERDGELVVDVKDSSRLFRVVLYDPPGGGGGSILGRRVSFSGVERGSGITVIEPDDFRLESENGEHAEVLTKAADIRRLTPERAALNQPVNIQGVVTMVSPGAMVLQDSTGGVYVRYSSADWVNYPKPGELWRVRGNTARGDFSPTVIADRVEFEGMSYLPEPVKPTWEQFLSGNLDAEQVEIEGVLVVASHEMLKLLTREGTVEIMNQRIYPLPEQILTTSDPASLVGSLVRIRGVYASSWDVSIARVHPARLQLGNSVMSVDSPPPVDPFAAPAVKIQELHRFASESNSLNRVKITGMVLSSNPPEFLLCDGSKGFRVVSRHARSLEPGSVVEAVGFPRMGGPSPVLLEAEINPIGTGPLPAPLKVVATALPDSDLDSLLIEIDAEVLGDTTRQGKRVLELRSGPNSFVALIPNPQLDGDTIQRESIVRIRGVYVGLPADRSVENPDRFELRVGSDRDVLVLKHGPWWTTRHTIILIFILSGGLVIASMWVTALRRTVAKRSKELAREIEEREMVERQRVMEQERSRVAQDLHDELGAGLTEVGMLSSALRNDSIPPQRKIDYLNQLSSVSFNLVSGLDEIVWAVNPRYDSVADLAGYFSLFAQNFLGLAGVSCRLNIDKSIPDFPLDSSKRHGIFLAFKETINNVVRHSGASEVQLRIGIEGDDLLISVSDNGRGFDLSVVEPGSDGLQGMTQRIRQMGGVCELESSIGHGTCVSFRIKTENQL